MHPHIPVGLAQFFFISSAEMLLHGFPITIFHIFHRWIIINWSDFIIVFNRTNRSYNIIEFIFPVVFVVVQVVFFLFISNGSHYFRHPSHIDILHSCPCNILENCGSWNCGINWNLFTDVSMRCVCLSVFELMTIWIRCISAWACPSAYLASFILHSA